MDDPWDERPITTEGLKKMRPTFQMADLWETLVDAGPDDECLVAGEVRHTRRTLDEAANRIGHTLADRGVRPGGHVGIYARNRAEYLEAMFGCWKIGARPININWRYVADELRYVVADAELRAMIVEREYLQILDEIADELGDLVAILVLEDGTESSSTGLIAESFSHAVSTASSERSFDVERSADDVYIIYTGGTTGMPKGVMWRHEDFFYGCLMGGNPMSPIKRPEDIAAHVTPAYRMNALVLGQLMHGSGQWLTLITIYSGNEAIIYTDWHFSPEHVLDLIERERPQTLGLVGDAMARPIADAAQADPERWDLSGLVTIGNGGAMLTASVKDQFRAVFPGIIITDSFGASETGAGGSDLNKGPATRGPAFTSDGRTAVLDPMTLEPLEPGSPEQGMLARRGNIPSGYWKDPEKTAATFRTDSNGVRWVIPGDFAMLDGDGRVVLLGRGSECINSGGEKIFPEEVEASIRAHPDVFDAIVVGLSDEKFGQRVVAMVTLRDGASELTLNDLQIHCRTMIAGYKVPRALLIGESPRTNIGKPDYAAARRIARECLEV
jgi:3-oxocholest-4-en-26-oate---CoA ligase